MEGSLFQDASHKAGQCHRVMNTAGVKASDDEFLMVSLAGIIGNNSIGYSHKYSKVNRGIIRSSYSLLKQAVKNQRWYVVKFGPNKFIDVVWVTGGTHLVRPRGGEYPGGSPARGDRDRRLRRGLRGPRRTVCVGGSSKSRVRS